MNPRVLFCDNHLIAVDKPTGLATQSDRDNEHSLTLWVRQWVKEIFEKPNAAFAEPIHRLDKVTSGLVIFAKTGKALSRMTAEVRQRRWQKSYFALVEAKQMAPEGTLEHHLVRRSFRSKVNEYPIGSVAKTHYRLLARSEGLCLLLLSPQTGRYHQLRVQLAHMGWPIGGDGKYGAQRIKGDGGIYLHHGRCAIAHPIDKQTLSFEVMPPLFWPQWALEVLCKTSDQSAQIRSQASAGIQWRS